MISITQVDLPPPPLRLYADDTMQYIAHESPCTLESTLNQAKVDLRSGLLRTT